MSFVLLTPQSLPQSRANGFEIHDVRLRSSHLNCFSLEASNRRRGTGALLVDGSIAAADVCGRSQTGNISPYTVNAD